MNIDREATFRGRLLEWAVNTTANGFPQFVVKLLALEMWDENADFGEEPGWVSWEEYQQEITAFLVLFDRNNKPCLNYQQVQTAFGWDGTSFAALDSGDWSNTVLQFRVEESEYQGQTRMKVTWVDAQDAVPGKTIKRLDTKDLKDLDAKFKTALGATPKPKKADKPASPPKPASLPKPAAKPEPTPEPTPEPEAPAEPKKQSGPPKRQRGKGKKSEPEMSGGLPSACTMTDAWEKVLELRDESEDESHIADVWTEVVDEIASAANSEDDVTPEQWAQVRDAVLGKIKSHKF